MNGYNIKSLDAHIENIRPEGLVTIAISAFDVEDHAHDIVRKGAFAGTFARDSANIKHVVDHIHDVAHIVGTPQRMEETDRYAIIESKLILDKSIGHDLFVTYKHLHDEGKAMEHSYAYRTLRRNENKQIKGEDIAELEMLEYSTVFRGCNPLTPTLDVKGLYTIDDCVSYIDDLERMLRKCDFSDKGGRRIEQVVSRLEGVLTEFKGRSRPAGEEERRKAFNDELRAAFKDSLFN